MKSGFAAIIGRPSAGKSTILNALCGEKVAITSPVPQTTRNAIRGIINRPQGQIVFLDTPGYHESEKKLNLYLKDVVHRTLSDADLVLYVVDASRSPGREEQAIMDLLSKSGKTVIAALNKCDLNTPLIQEIRGFIRVNLKPASIVEISAVAGTNLDAMVEALFDACPEGEAHYPADFYTDQNPEFRIAEIIREQAITRTEKELPHALYVEIIDMEFEKDEEDKLRGGRGSRGDARDSRGCRDSRGAGGLAGDADDPPAEDSVPKATDITADSAADEPIKASDSATTEPAGTVDSGEAPTAAPADEEVPLGAPAGFFDEVEAEEADVEVGSGRTGRPEKRKTLWVRAFLVVESKSQVGILVGHQGKKIRSIRIGALKEMKKIFPWKVRLDLRVKVNPKWRKKDPLLKRMLGPGE